MKARRPSWKQKGALIFAAKGQEMLTIGPSNHEVVYFQKMLNFQPNKSAIPRSGP